MNPITYLDNAAAMPVAKDTISHFAGYSEKYYANPEAVHSKGREANLAIQNAANDILSVLTVEGGYSLFFTTSATEAINIAVDYPGFKNKTIVTTDAEHGAMRSAIDLGEFCEIRKVSINKDGSVDLTDLENKLDSDVAAVSIHHVQNETGVQQKLTEIRKIIDKKSPDAVFIVDSVQSVGKMPIPWKEAKINIGFVAGHKVGAPTGGALIYNLKNERDNSFSKYLKDIRSVDHSIGRPDTSVCITLADVIKRVASLDVLESIIAVNRYLRSQLTELKSADNLELKLLIPEDSSSPYITTFLLPPYQAEILVRMLADKGVMVSAGSACEASNDKPSQTLLAMGISPADARTALRISFAFDSEIEDVDKFTEAFKDVIDNY